MVFEKVFIIYQIKNTLYMLVLFSDVSQLVYFFVMSFTIYCTNKRVIELQIIDLYKL